MPPARKAQGYPLGTAPVSRGIGGLGYCWRSASIGSSWLALLAG